MVQLEVDLREPRAARVERVAGLVSRQRGVDLIVLPELWPAGAFAYPAWEGSAEPVDGPLVRTMSEAARAAGTTVHMGSFIERGETGQLFNTSMVLDAHGQTLATYRKMHRFGFSDGEPRLLGAGTDTVVYDARAHGRWGLATCYDLRFPELFRALVDGGSDVFVVVAGWPQARIGHWSLLARARAVENQAFVLACNATGQQGRTTLGGRSLVVDPWGEVVAEAGTEQQVLTVDVDLDLVRRTREDFPVLRDRVLPVPSPVRAV